MRATIDSRNITSSIHSPVSAAVSALLAGAMLAIISGSALAHESDDVIVRGGAALVSPHESASPSIVGLSGNTLAELAHLPPTISLQY
jgi:outer membrane protein W